jgi:carboxylate-amine ligase
MGLLLEPSAESSQKPKPRVPDELVFRPSSRTTLGAELELQIIDLETTDLAPGAVRILHGCKDESIEGVSAELMQSMIEIKTDVCTNVGEVRNQLVSRMRRVRNVASSMGYELVMAGTHPFHRATGSVVFPDARYERILDRLAWLIHQRVVFGMHVHVGMPSGDMAIGVMNILVQNLPHLLALSANSPFWQGVDTGLESCRTALYRSLPHAGVPRYFPNWKGFRTFCRVMRDCKAITSSKDIYWDIRPRPELGTIEFRVCDMPASLGMVFSLVTLIHCLCINALRLLEQFPRLRRGDMRRHWIAVENKWLATRYGLGAMYVRTPGGKRRPLDHDLGELIQRLMPIAEETGDARYLKSLLPTERLESGAEHQRRQYRDTGSWKALIEDMTRRLSDELGALSPASVNRPTAPVA